MFAVRLYEDECLVDLAIDGVEEDFTLHLTVQAGRAINPGDEWELTLIRTDATVN